MSSLSCWAYVHRFSQTTIITRQTYAEGVLLESSNAETWTPLNGSDLTMCLYGFDFQDQGSLQFQPVSGV